MTGSRYNILSGNTVYNNTLHGISLQSASDANNITENTVYKNIQHGIYLDGSFDLFIWDNYIYQNGISGIFIDDCQNDEFFNNIIQGNVDTGVSVTASSDMFFHENFFLGNGKHAFDDSTTSWNSTTIGNYWDNLTGTDVNPEDGIVDDPYDYNISGSAGNIDYFPIAEDGAPQITINSPSEGDAFSSVAPNFNVEITDDYLDAMWYTLDGGSNNYTFTENGMINQTAWDGMSDGAITFTFYARDIPGYIGSADVEIIKDSVAPVILINSPSNSSSHSDAPTFTITIIDQSPIDKTW